MITLGDTEEQSGYDEYEYGASLAEVEAGAEKQYEVLVFSEDKLLTTASSSSPLKELRESISSDIIGDKTTFMSPFSLWSSKDSKGELVEVPLIYCDHTASNRALHSIETFIEHQCLPVYGNTHTLTSYTGSQSTSFVAEARQIVAECVNAKITGKASTDVIMFTGSGATCAIELLIDCLGVKHQQQQQPHVRPVVFVGPFEHHSNLIPWRESGCEVVQVAIHPTTGGVDLRDLERLLSDPMYGYCSCNLTTTTTATIASTTTTRLRMGTFSAASNITGRITDTNVVTALLHKYNVLSFWDFATGASYLPIDMNPSTQILRKGGTSHAVVAASDLAKDAIFLSTHKMLGGPGSPGILVVKKHLVSQMRAPSRSGGGTVFYVSHDHHRFLSNRVERYEGGSPNVPGIVRSGLAFLYKRRIQEQLMMTSTTRQQQQQCTNNSHTTEEHSTSKHSKLYNTNPVATIEFNTWKKVVDTLSKTAPNIVILGTSCSTAQPISDVTSTSVDLEQNQHEPNLPIFSFLIKCGSRFLHYNFVCALLNDLFGIQTRGGCQCAGPYAQYLLGLTDFVVDDDSSANDRCYSRLVANKSNRRIEEALLDKNELLRIGFSRLSLPFFVRDEEVQFILTALAWIAENGWKFLYQYRCNHRTGEWRHCTRQGRPLGANRKWLNHYVSPFKHSQSVDISKNAHVSNIMDPGDGWKGVLHNALENANALLEQSLLDHKSILQVLNATNDGSDILPYSVEDLRWYVYPKECAKMLYDGAQPNTSCVNGVLHGAIRPLECCPLQQFHTNSIRQHVTTVSNVTEVVVATAKKLHSEAKTEQAVAVTATAPSIQSERPNGTTVSNVTGDVVATTKKLHGEVKTEQTVAITATDQSIKSERRDVTTVSNVTEDVVATTEKLQSEAKTEQAVAITATAPNAKKAARDSAIWGRSSCETGLCGLQSCSDVSEAQRVEIGRPINTSNGGRVKPPAKMMRLITQAILQWNMIEDGDRLLLGLSGGKDSLSLLHCLLELQRRLPVQFTVQVCTIDPMTPSFDPSPLIPYVTESLGLQYHYIRADIVARAATSGKDGQVVSSLCAFCARMKRGALYQCARDVNANKLVLAQHLDDLAESFFMSAMHNGFLRTMKAHYQINAGDLSVIRPLVYCRESLMTEFAASAGLPVINENCPACFEEPKERARIKKLLSKEGTLYPKIYDNVRKAILPLMHEEATAVMRCFTEEAMSKTRKQQGKKSINTEQQSTKDEQSKDVDEEKKESYPDNGASDDSKHHLKPHREHGVSLAEASEEQLATELIRRRAEKFRLHGAMTAKKGWNRNVTEIPS